MGTSEAQLQRLLGEADWIRRLARGLVGDEGDDLAQDAWLAVLRQPPDPDRPPRPWLKRVILNLRAMRARGTSRRLAREAASAPDEATAADPETLALDSVPSGAVALICEPNAPSHERARVPLTLEPGSRPTVAVTVTRKQ